MKLNIIKGLLLLTLIFDTQLGFSQNMKLGDPLPGNLFVELHKLVNPAVVNISIANKPIIRRRGNIRPNDPFFEFFEQFMGPQMDRMPEQPQALGTGFIIDESGLIVTNTHVINQADEIKVQLVGDKKFYAAEIIGKDERSDVALIKIKADKKLPTVKLGSSASVEVGEWVAAFGNPFGHSNTMSKGIISAKDRSIAELNNFPFLQTDASINPGNSGGPLVNTKGEVIGVNTAIDARAQGIGFAIPVDNVKAIIEQLKTKGRVSRGYLGINLADIDIRAARQLGLNSDNGALVVDVMENSPASRAGLRVYDVITKFGSREISSARDLMNAVLDQPVGQSANVEVFRNSKKISLKVTPAERDVPQAKKPSRKATPPGTGDQAPFELGFQVDKLTPKIAKNLNVKPQKSQPPVVTRVEPDSVAFRAGLHVGDIILDVNKTRVNDVKDVMKNLKSGLNVLRVQRGEMVTLVFIENR